MTSRPNCPAFSGMAGRASTELAMVRRYIAFATTQMKSSTERIPTAMEAFAGVAVFVQGLEPGTLATRAMLTQSCD